MTALEPVRRLIASAGPIGYDTFVSLALYDPEHGFYAAGGSAGRRTGDFITSPEVGPLFGAVIARRLAEHWLRLGRPSPFVVTEVGAGRGTLARTIQVAAPPFLADLEYVLVETSAALRATHPVTVAGQDPGRGSFRSSPSWPERSHVILANELLDNLPFRIARWVDDRWAEVVVDVDADGGLGEAIRPLAEVPHEISAVLARLAATGPPEGTETPLAIAADAWVRESRVRASLVLAFDYGAPTAQLAARPQRGWLRTYAGHTRRSNPLVAVGEQDITSDVPIDQLPAPDVLQPQSEWLRTHGLAALVRDGERVWRERAAVGDLVALRARSRSIEAESLCAATGLGGFLVAEWHSAGPEAA